MKRIEITVLSGGETRLETRGFSGDACRAASGPLIEALGLTTRDRPTVESYSRSAASASQQTTAHQQTTGQEQATESSR